MRKSETWVILADATRARAVRLPGHQSELQRQPIETVFEASAEHPPLREIMSDAPGRSFASTGARRSSMEPSSDPEREAVRKFASSILHQLADRLGEGAFDQLVICAPPRMLSAFREAMPAALAPAVRSEIAKDFTKLPEIELSKVLRELAAPPD